MLAYISNHQTQVATLLSLVPQNLNYKTIFSASQTNLNNISSVVASIKRKARFRVEIRSERGWSLSPLYSLKEQYFSAYK